MRMTIEKLSKVKLHELKDLYSAEKQLLEHLPGLVEMATDEGLERELQGHMQTTQMHLKRIEDHFEGSEYSPEGHRCRGMEGLLDEIRETGEAEDGAPRDALLVAGLQRAQHYLVAGYGSARAFAEKLGKYDLSDTLAKSLDESRDFDRRLTGLAERSINFEAMAK